MESKQVLIERGVYHLGTNKPDESKDPRWESSGVAEQNLEEGVEGYGSMV